MGADLCLAIGAGKAVLPGGREKVLQPGVPAQATGIGGGEHDLGAARRACGHAGPYRSTGGRLVGERDDAARRWGCAEKLQRERLAVATASRSPAD
jgi:hypothetical protein